jgi:hypothetical protein
LIYINSRLRTSTGFSGDIGSFELAKRCAHLATGHFQ